MTAPEIADVVTWALAVGCAIGLLAGYGWGRVIGAEHARATAYVALIDEAQRAALAGEERQALALRFGALVVHENRRARAGQETRTT